MPIPTNQANIKGIMYVEILSSNIMKLQREPNINSKSNSKDYAIVLSYNLLLFCCYHCKILYPKQENDLSIYKLNGLSQFSLSFSLSPRG